jgi:ligand-binding SRPBCC domain-containing protein
MSLRVMSYSLERTTFIRRPRSEVFAFFADAHNLERITPSFLRFHILTPDPIEMKPGTLIDYEMKLYGFPVRWRTVIQLYKPDEVFVDVQLSGPYRSWRHRHQFTEVPGGTEMHDRVDYEMPFGIVGSVVRRLFVRASLDRIFDHRNEAIARYYQ